MDTITTHQPHIGIATPRGYRYPGVSKEAAKQCFAEGLTVAETAERLSASVGTIYNWIKSGDLSKPRSRKKRDTKPVKAPSLRLARIETEATIRRLWDEGAPVLEIADRTGANRGFLGSVLGVGLIGRTTIKLATVPQSWACPRCGCVYATKKRAVSGGRLEIRCKFCSHQYVNRAVYVRQTRRGRARTLAASVARAAEGRDEAAKKLGISRTTLWRYLRGGKVDTASALQKT